MLTFIVMLIVVGLIAGAIARLLMPGRDPIGLLGTILLGVAGSFVGGFLENLLFYHRLAPHRFHFAGIIGLDHRCVPGATAGARFRARARPHPAPLPAQLDLIA